MILKSYIIEKNINELTKFRSALLYGENDGIKDDVKTKLKLLLLVFISKRPSPN